MPSHINHTIDQLLVLDTIIRTGSFGAAAKELHRVPSAISYSIKSLEENLDLKIFDRSRQKAVLTAEGHRILEEGRSVIEQARQLEFIATQIRDGWEPELRIVVDGLLPMRGISRSLKVFAEEEIPTRISIDVEYQQGVMERFREDRADYMIVLSMEDVTDGLEAEPLPEIELLLVAAKDHPLSQGNDVDISKRFAELVVRDSSSGFRKKDKESFTGSQHIVWLADFHSKRMAILDGAGFGWMPRHLIQQDLEQGELVMLEDRPLFSWTYNPQLVYRTSARMGKASLLFKEILLQSTVQNI